MSSVDKTQTDMKQHYWDAMQTIKFQEYYLKEYNNCIVTMERCILTIVSIVTAASVASWSIWNIFSVPWAACVAVVDFLQIIWPHLPYSKRAAAIKYVLPEIKQLTLDMENFWYQADHSSDPDYIQPLNAFRQRWLDIQARYFESDSLPDIKWIHAKAQTATNNHMDLYFAESDDTEGGDDIDTKESV